MDILWRVKYVLLFHTTNVFFRFQWLNVMRALDPTTEHHSVSGGNHKHGCTCGWHEII